MSKNLKRLLSALLVIAMIMSVLPTIAAARQEQKETDPSEKVYVYTDEDFAELRNDVFAQIEVIKTQSAQKMGGIGVMKEADYASLIPQVIRAVESSSTYAKGTLEQHGNYLYWQTVKGIACCYDPRMEAELNNTEDAPSPEEIARVEADAAAMLQPPKRGGTPTSINVGLIQPYWESSSSYSDSSFLDYSPYYKTTWQNLYGATGGQGIRYSMTNVTVNTVASTMEQCGLVIFDSHGTTDYSGSNQDYTSRANSSYLCINSTSGLTSTDTATKTGPYGSYSDAVVSGSSAFINGTAIANHMSGNAPHSMLYMGICLGMSTDKMFTGLRAKDVNTVYGYSQSVSFTGELKSIQSIMAYIQNDMQAGAAIEQSQTDLGCQWDPAYSSYSESSARSNKVAFPVVVSDEDTYLGHGNVDCVQTAHSEWHLFGAQYTVTATSNNTSWGTVSVNGTTITATPKTGYYAAGYTVTSGTATVVQNGNTFSVTPTSDCTVRINFAAKTAATVTYVANGTTVSTVNTYVGDSVTLPAAQADVDDWSFEGWIPGTLAETSDKPTYYKPNTAYTVSSASVTMYALYTRLEASGSGEVVYQLSDGIESGSKYILVDETSVSGTSGYAVGNAIVSNSHYLNAVAATINDDLCTVASSSLASVVWQVASSGSGYTFYNAAVGKYIGLDSSEFVYPSSTPLAWAYTSEGYLDNQSDSEGYYYLSFDTTNIRYTTNKSGKVIRLYKETNAGTTYYTTNPVNAAHEHTMEYVAAAAPTCTVAGNTAYYHCTTCNKYYSDANGENEITLASTVIAALGHNYVDVVTAPTETTQGYTTHTCSRCGDSYVDTYVPALGSDFTVHFSVPVGVTAPADMVSNTNTGITLPTADAPEGYTFLGWVTEDYDNVETRPAAILTGTYIAPQEITLKALYTYTEGNGGVAYELLSAAPADWTGNYVISYGTDTNMYLMKGVTVSSNGASIESTANAAAYAAAGVSLDGTTLTGVANDYVFAIAKQGSYYSIQNLATGTYLGEVSSNGYLGGYTTYNSTTCDWTPGPLDGASSMAFAHYTSSSNYYPYVGFAPSYQYFWSASSSNTTRTSIRFWQETQVGTTYYTTIIGEEHEHTPAAAVIENEIPATCTTAGSYDSVVYCSECGEELSRETVTVEALGHNWGEYVVTTPATCTAEGVETRTCSRCGATETRAITATGHTAAAAVKENEVAATCTAAGGYDMVVYCSVCGAELSREHTAVDALGHNPGTPVEENRVEPTETADGGYDTVVYCTRCNAELSREHTVLPATGSVLKFKRATLSLESDISINFYVLDSVLEGYTDPYVVFTKEIYDNNGNVKEIKTETVDTFTLKPIDDVTPCHVFTFAGINSTEMGSKVTATLYATKNGQTVEGQTVNYSVLTYVNNMLSRTTDAKFRTLLVDLLNYGASAQTYFVYNTANLVNKDLTAEQQSWATQDDPRLENHKSKTVNEGATVHFKTVTLKLEEKISMYFYLNLEEYTGDVNDLEAHMTFNGQEIIVDGSTFPTRPYSGVDYKVAIMDCLNALQMRQMVTVELFSKTTHERVSDTVTYSIVSFANSKVDDPDTGLKTLTQNMIKFGDAARAYFVG